MKNILKGNILFKNFNSEEIEKLLNQITYKVLAYKKDDFIAFRKEQVKYLQIILEGNISTQMVDKMGKVVVVEHLNEPQMIAPAFIFGNSNRYPVDVCATSNVKILQIHKESFLNLLSNNKAFLNNFLNVISNKTQFLSERLKFMSISTIKAKFCFYIIEIADECDTVDLPLSQQQLSNYFAVERPSLTRAIADLKKEGIIDLKGKTLKILKRDKLYNYLT